MSIFRQFNGDRSAPRTTHWGAAALAVLALALPGMAAATQNNWSGPGTYGEIKTNWWQMGWSKCDSDTTNSSCARTFTKSTLWVAKYASQPTHFHGETSNPSGNTWTVTDVGGGYYTIKNNKENLCVQAQGGSAPSRYLGMATCNTSDTLQKFQIYDSSAGGATGGMELMSTEGGCWVQDAWSTGTQELRVNSSGTASCGSWYAVFYFGGTYTPTPPDHYEIVTPASAVNAGSSTTITLKACNDATCSSLYSGTPSGIGVATTAGTLGSLSAWSGGSATISLTGSVPASATLSLTGTASPAASNSVQCYNGSTRNATTSCVVTFQGPDHYEIVTPATAPLAGASTTLTVKACANASCSSLYTSSTPSGIGVATSSGTLGSLSAWSGGSATISLTNSSPGTPRVSLTGTAAPAASNTWQCYNGTTRNATTGCDVSFSGPDHYEIVTPASNPAAGTSTTITLKACADASCSSLYTANTPSGIGVSTTAGTLGSLSAWSGGSATISLTKSTIGSATLNLTGTASPAASNSMQCYNGSTRNATTSCAVTFTGPDHYEIVTPSSNPTIGDTVTLTLKACGDTSCSSLYTGSTPSGIGVSTTSGTLGSLSAWSGGSATISLTKAVTGTATLSLTGTASPAATNTWQCYNGSTRNATTACQVTFDTDPYIGSYGGLKTNWKQLGDSACGSACAKSAANSSRWVGHGKGLLQPQSTHAYAVSSYPGYIWDVAKVGAFYTIQRHGTTECLAVGNSGGDAGYLIFKTCNSSDDTQQWNIYASTAGGAVGGVELKTNGAVPAYGSHCWVHNEYTVGELFVQSGVCGGWREVFYLTPPTIAPYVKLIHNTTGSVCDSSNVTVRTCTDSSCATPYPYTIDVTVNGSTVTVEGDGGTATVPVSHTTAEDLTLSATSEVSGTTYGCVDSGNNATNCKISFQNGVLSMSLASSSFYAHKGTTATLTAKKFDGTQCNPLLTGNQTINFWGLRSGSQSLSVNNTDVATVSSGTSSGTAVTVTFDANGVASSIPVNYDDAGGVTVNAIANQTSPALTASAALISVPAGFCITTANSTGCASGDPTSASCNKFVAAGDDFSMTVQAVAWESDADTDYCSGNVNTNNYASTSSVNLSTTLVQPSDGVNATLGTATASLTGGSSTIANQTVSEVGIFTLAASTTESGLAVPQVSSASQSANIGRFVPKKLDVALTNTPVMANGPDNTWMCAMTYVGQDFHFATAPEIRVRGLNTQGTVTKNYRATNFWKMGSTLSHSYSSAGGTGAGATLSAPTGTPTVTDDAVNFARNYSLPDTLHYGHDQVVAANDAPFTPQLKLTIPATTLLDSDGACYLSASTSCDPVNGGDAFETTLSGTPVSILLGQGAIQSVHVPTMSSADVPVMMMYWTGAGWSPNTLDSCTNAVNVSYGNYRGSLSAADFSSMPGSVTPTVGSALIHLPAPQKAGSVDITLDNLPAYLTTVRPGTPTATATFSNSATGTSRNLLFRREIQRGGN